MTRFPRDGITYPTILLLLVLCGLNFLIASFSMADQQENKGDGDARATERTSRRRISSMTLEEIRAALKINPKDALLFYRAGYLEEQKGNLGQAMRDYQEAINLKARVADAYFRLGIVWEKTGEFYDLRGGNPKGRMVSGEQRRKAINAYREAIRSRPDFSDAYYRLTLVYLVGDDVRRANEAYQKLHKLEPDTERTRQLLLMIYKRHQEQSRKRR